MESDNADKAEFYRDEHVQIIENAIAMFYADPTKQYTELAGHLVDNGIRFLSTNERVCKGLTENEIAQIKEELNLYMDIDGTMEYVADVAIEAVQNKLGLIDT